MKVNMQKLSGGTLVPASDADSLQMQGFKTGEEYEIDIKRVRNPRFHSKVLKFFRFCFAHWDQSQTYTEFMTPANQFDRFRKDLTILAGYYEQTVRLNGDIRTEAKSLSFGSMDQDEFEACYNALIQAAMKHIFHNSNDRELYDKLFSFF